MFDCTCGLRNKNSFKCYWHESCAAAATALMTKINAAITCLVNSLTVHEKYGQNNLEEREHDERQTDEHP
jgi:hypothetical protein